MHNEMKCTSKSRKLKELIHGTQNEHILLHTLPIIIIAVFPGEEVFG